MIAEEIEQLQQLFLNCITAKWKNEEAVLQL